MESFHRFSRSDFIVLLCFPLSSVNNAWPPLLLLLLPLAIFVSPPPPPPLSFVSLLIPALLFHALNFEFSIYAFEIWFWSEKFLNRFWSALVSIILLKERGFLVEDVMVLFLIKFRSYSHPILLEEAIRFLIVISAPPAFVTAEKLEWKEGYWDKVNDRNGYPFFLSFFTRARGKRVVKDPDNVTSSCGFIASKILLSKCRTMESWKEATHTFVIKTNSLIVLRNCII